MKRNLILTPGPTVVPPEVCEVLGRPIIHHRTPQFQAVLKEATEGLQYVFQTKGDVYILTSSGTGAMEAAVANVLSAGDRAITVEGGKFGERWTEICKAYGVVPDVLTVEWGKAPLASDIEALLKKNPAVKAVFITLCETSTGVTPDVKAIAQAVAKTGAIVVVDAISGLGVVDLKTDEWGLDIVVTGSQKGLMLPPGLAFISVSPKALALMEKSASPKYYFDLKKAKKAAEKTDTPFTPALGIIRALNEALKMVKAQGIEKLFAHYARMAEATRAAAKALGLKLLAEPSCASDVVTAIFVPDNIDAGKLVKTMRDTYGITIAAGQGHLEKKIIRIAHMGCLDEFDILAGIACLEKVLKQMGHSFPLGAGISAAQKVFNS